MATSHRQAGAPSVRDLGRFVIVIVIVVVVLPLALVGVVTALVVALVTRMRFSVPGAQGADAGELRTHVRTFSHTHSTLGVSRSGRRRHADELKANLAESVAADGIRAALAGLGPAGALATGYADYRPRPTWVVGVVVSALTLAVTMWVHLQLAGAYADGWTDAMGHTGGAVSGNGARMNSLAVSFEWIARSGSDIAVHVSSPWLWVLPIAAFFIASHSWRTLTMRNTASVSV